MALAQSLLDILVCPDSKLPVTRAHQELVDALNRKISSGELLTISGKAVSGAVSDALVRSDGKRCYLVRDEIPIMLVDEAVALPL